MSGTQFVPAAEARACATPAAYPVAAVVMRQLIAIQQDILASDYRCVKTTQLQLDSQPPPKGALFYIVFLQQLTCVLANWLLLGTKIVNIYGE